MALPNLPDLFASLACIGVQLACPVHSLYARKQVGQVGQVGHVKQRRGFPLPNLNVSRSGRSGRAGWVSAGRSAGGQAAGSSLASPIAGSTAAKTRQVQIGRFGSPVLHQVQHLECNAMTELSQVEYARSLGCSAAYVTKLKRHGRLVVTCSGKVDVEASNALIRATRRKSVLQTDRAVSVALNASHEGSEPRKCAACARPTDIPLAQATDPWLTKAEVFRLLCRIMQQALDTLAPSMRVPETVTPPSMEQPQS